MMMVSAIGNGRSEAVVDALKAEFGAIMAARIMEAEALDFLWDARVGERYLGQQNALDDDALELSRVAIMGVLAGQAHVAVCLVDGEGDAVELLWKRKCDCWGEALAAFQRAH